MLIFCFSFLSLIPDLQALSIPTHPSIFQLPSANISSFTPPTNTTSLFPLLTSEWPTPPYIFPYNDGYFALKFFTYGSPGRPSLQRQIIANLDTIIYRILKGADSYESQTHILVPDPFIELNVLFLRRVSSVTLALALQTIRELMDVTGFGPREIGHADFGVRAPWVPLGKFSIAFKNRAGG